MTDIDDPIAHLRTMEQPTADELAGAPVLDDWVIAPTIGDVEGMFTAHGRVSASRKFEDDHRIGTSAIASADHAGRWIRTRNTLYRLGAKHQQSPFFVHVATRKDWLDAWRAACEGTGQHTVQDWVWAAAVESSRETVDWTRRRAAATAVGNELARAGRPSVARAWWMLATDASDKDAAAGIFESLCTAAGSYQTPEASDVIDGWGLLAKASAETAGEDLSDCIAAARRIGDFGKAEKHTMPLIVLMARAPNATTAARVFLSVVRIPAALAEQFDMQQLLDPKTRRETARLMIDQHYAAGAPHDDLYMGLRLLCLNATDLIGCNLIRSKIEAGLLKSGNDPKDDRVAWSWRALASGLAAPFDPDDPIRSAWHLNTPPVAEWTGTDALKELAINVDDNKMAARECGAIVLEKVGGTTETSSGKDATREFKAIAGERLRLVCASDLSGIRTRLHDEFPHLHTQIDVLLSDLTEGEPIRLRPTLLVGLPGGGKSRLARRMAESLDVGLHRFDGAGSGDNAFGGTPRRWSTGEHCVPLEAVRRFAIANPWMLIDEADKAATSGHNGSLVNALLPMLDGETSKIYPDPYVQSDVDLSNVSYLLTANDDTALPSPLRDRLRVVRLPEPTIEHLPALARGIVSDIARERGGDARWWPNLEDGELAIAEELWPGGSVRRLRAIVERILAYREQKPRN